MKLEVNPANESSLRRQTIGIIQAIQFSHKQKFQRYGENKRTAASRNRMVKGRASISASVTSRAVEIFFAMTISIFCANWRP